WKLRHDDLSAAARHRAVQQSERDLRLGDPIMIRLTKRRLLRDGAALVILLAPVALRAQAAPAYDVVIRNGRVLDGEGSPWILADVAIRNGRFVKIGKVAGRGRTEIDATGKYVSPGWIDMMDQSGTVLPKNGRAENKLQEGVTTAIAGED